jgi:hypothetical protein
METEKYKPEQDLSERVQNRKTQNYKLHNRVHTYGNSNDQEGQ